MEMLAVAAEGAWRVASPRLPMAPNGAGDAVAALFPGFYLKTASVPEALAAAASAIFEVLQTTLDAGEEELQLVRSEAHTSELQSLMRTSYAVFCLNKQKPHTKHTQQSHS